VFLILFSLADILGFSRQFVSLPDSSFDYFYYTCNSLYILSYLFLIVQVLKNMNIREVISKFPIHIIILVVLDIFCVSIVTETTKGSLSIYEYSLEFLYNAVMMSLLTLAVINYINKEDKQAMNLLVGSIFIVFAEMIQLAYFYVSSINFLNVLCSLFLVLAFAFFYLQANESDSESVDANLINH
jgi:hypothetical protein